MSDPACDIGEQQARFATDVAAAILDPKFAIPTLPSSAAEVMALANLSEVDFRRVDGVVRRDPLIAARVLSVANSPVYSARGGVMSLRTAMMLLGWRVLRDVLWQVVAEAHIFRSHRRHRLKHQRHHAVAVAHLTRRLSLELSLDTEHAFVAGLLHDIGETLADQALAGPLGEGLEDDARDQLSAQLHTDIGPRIARAWSIPEEAAEAMALHHQFDQPHLREATEAPAPLPIAVAASERLAASIGLGDDSLVIAHDDPVASRIFASLGLTIDDALALVERWADLPSQI